MAESPEYAPGHDDRDGQLLCAALLRGHPLAGLRHILKKCENTVWHKIALAIGGNTNGDAGDKIVAACKGVRIAGHDEQGTRRFILAKITERDGWVEGWLDDDEQYKKRRRIKRNRYAGVADMYDDTTWLWKPWFAEGYLSMLCGRPGIGKSMVAAWFATIILKGGVWPDGTEHIVAPCDNPDGHIQGECSCPTVMWIDTEGTQKLLIQRFKEMGTPMSQVFYPTGDRPEDGDFPIIDLAKQKWRDEVHGLALDERPTWCFIDSLRGAHTAKEKDEGDMQALLSWAAAITRDMGCGWTFTHHLRKSMPGESREIELDEVRGSGTIVAMMRTVVALDKPDPRADALRLHVIKNNLERIPEPLGLELAATGGAPVPVSEAPRAQRAETLTERACDFLESRLKDGPRTPDEIYYEAKQIGISERTVQIAKKKLEIVSIAADSTNPKWRWALRGVPPDDRAVEEDKKRRIEKWDDTNRPF